MLKQPNNHRQQTLNKLVDQSFQSGRVNLSSLGLTCLPDALFEDSAVVDYSFEISRERTDLTRLLAADNSLMTLDARIGDLFALSVLDLRNNLLTSIPSALGKLENISVLNLSHNKLYCIDPVLVGLPLLELVLTGNQITALPLEIKNLQMLVLLDLSDNRIEEIPDELGALSKLFRLNLSRNKLRHINPSSFRFPLLNELDFSDNQIEHVAGESDMPKLQLLDIKRNSLESFDWKLKCPLIRELSVAFNKLVQIDPDAFSGCPSLEIADLRDNNLPRIPVGILSLKKLKRLDISNNDIGLLAPELGLMTSLTSVLFAGNPLRGIPTGSTVRLLEVSRINKFLRNKIIDRKSSAPTASKPAPKTAQIHAVEELPLEDLCVNDQLELELTSLHLVAFPDNISARYHHLESLILAKNNIDAIPLLNLPYLKVRFAN